jgi:hypothetical protein
MEDVDVWRGGSALEGLTTSSKSGKKFFSQTERGILGSVSAGLGEGRGWPALKTAATDPRGSFTAAAAKARMGQRWRTPLEMSTLVKEVQEWMKGKRPGTPPVANVMKKRNQ